MLRFFLSAFALLTSIRVYSQELIPNGSFESYTICPSIPGQIDFVEFWFDPSIANSTPDYFNACSQNNGSGVPENYLGTQEAHSGNAYLSLGLAPGGGLNLREYAECRLNQSLVANQCYHFEMWASIPDKPKYSTNDFGVYFSDTIINNIPNRNVLRLPSQINNSPSNDLDTSHWKLITADYLAHGGENYLLLGNFKDSLSTIINYTNPNGTFNTCNIYLDDLSLKRCIAPNSDSDPEIGVQVYPNPFNAFIKVVSSENGIYRLKVYDVLGQIVIQTDFSRETTIYASTIASALYFYELENSGVVIRKGKVIKED